MAADLAMVVEVGMELSVEIGTGMGVEMYHPMTV